MLSNSLNFVRLFTNELSTVFFRSSVSAHSVGTLSVDVGEAVGPVPVPEKTPWLCLDSRLH